MPLTYTGAVHRYVTMLALIIAGEIVFGLPFHTARFFRPTLLEAFGFTNTELGDLFAVYGITAMLSYFPGGALADRFPARSLLTASLFATAASSTKPNSFNRPPCSPTVAPDDRTDLQDRVRARSGRRRARSAPW